MAKKMLIDTTHAEETRVVVVSGTRLEEFDVETSTKKQLKGNIYLAKVVRVEPSLQAAFVEYGGGRHGFLAFNEIHPDYFQIPVADRQALIAEQNDVIRQSSVAADFDDGDEEEAPAPAPEPMVIESAGGALPGGDGGGEIASFDGEHHHDDSANGFSSESGETRVTSAHEDSDPEEEFGETPATQEDPERPRRRSLRSYKIQEVIKRRQILLVQVVKEERGNKGAALTTYLSLAGRYCVLMPNTARGGGVSRKITSIADRKRLKSIVNEMEIPPGMAVIVRTAGSERTKPEIRRDYEYLLRLWDSVRDLTLASTAPALVYEEANLIKRSIRDVYSRDIDEIHVEGEEGYRLAKDFMRMLTPSHARKVQLYRDPAMPLFHKYQVEAQLDAMHSPVVQLKSGGYLVINQAEALVAIDVNSGRSTKERHIEETALKTNLEAADEVARQLRLRDLAGLIVIDFIDMEETRNNHTVERRLKEAMGSDRARIQLGRISPFGLLELSRQRLRPSLMESSFLPCPHCEGTGMVRSVESAAMHVLRAIEEEGVRRRSSEITVTTHSDVALYILNQKRGELGLIETRYGFRVFLQSDSTLVPPAIRMDRVKSEIPIEIPAALPALVDDDPRDAEIEDEAVLGGEETRTETPAAERSEGKDDGGEDGRRRRRRRRRRGRRDEHGQPIAGSESELEPGEPEEGEESNGEVLPAVAGDAEPGGATSDATGDPATDLIDGQPAPRRRRGKRGGRRRQRRPGEAPLGTEAGESAENDTGETDNSALAEAGELEPAPTAEIAATEPETKPKRSRSRKKLEPEASPTITPELPGAELAAPDVEAKPKRGRSRKKMVEVEVIPEADVTAEPAPTNSPEMPAPLSEVTPAMPEIDPDQPARKGWWNRFL
jgi:ribonuclease E